MLEAIVAKRCVSRQNCFAVALRAETPSAGQCLLKLEVIVDFAIEYQMRVVLSRHRLSCGFAQIDNSEAAVSQTGLLVWRNPSVVAVRPAVSDQPTHDAKLLAW